MTIEEKLALKEAHGPIVADAVDELEVAWREALAKELDKVICDAWERGVDHGLEEGKRIAMKYDARDELEKAK